MTNLISLIIPVYNEAPLIANNLAMILNAANGDWYTLELLVIDDGSIDATAQEVGLAIALDKRIQLISFTRNFGKEAAIHAGLTHAKGDAAIVLDSDLQHPPALIQQMLQFWRQGIAVVEAVKTDRGTETVRHGLLARSFYALFSRFAGMDLHGHSDFKLLDRLVIDAYLSFPERQRFFRGIIGWAGYPSAQLPFSVPARAGGGASHWSRLKLLQYAIRNLTSFSSVPLKLVSYFGIGTLLLGAIIGINSLVQKFRGNAVDGFTTVNLLIIITSGAILLSLGIIGHYLARLYDEIKARPTYLLKPPQKTSRESSNQLAP
jgi:glycosyltransferase involved in cell wall biosynthesis